MNMEFNLPVEDNTTITDIIREKSHVHTAQYCPFFVYKALYHNNAHHWTILTTTYIKAVLGNIQQFNFNDVIMSMAIQFCCFIN